MKRTVKTAVWGVVAAAVLVPAGLQAAKIDSRLATVRKAHVVPIDELGEDVAIVACFVDLLPKLWDEGTKYRRSMMQQGQFGAGGADTAKTVECGLADGLIEKIRNAMREARGKAQ